MGSLIQLLDRPIAYQPAFAQLRAGKVKSGPAAAVLLSQLVYWHNRMDGEWLYKTREDIKKETGLSRDEQETARKRLVALGVLQEELRGVPATVHYRINTERLEALLLAPDQAESQMGATPPTRRRQPRQQDGGNAPNKMAETPPTSWGEPTQQAGGDPANFLTGDYTESTQVNPTHNAREDLQVEPVKQNPAPEYAGQPGIAYPAAPPLGKFQMSPDWTPSTDFRQRAAYWGFPVPDSLKAQELKAALASFSDYWIAEQKVFTQTQWEQKFARHLQNAKPPQPRGNTYAGLDPSSTANAAVQRMHAVRAEQLRARGENLEVLAHHGGNILQPVGAQKRLGPVGPMDCSDWEFDQRPDDERE